MTERVIRYAFVYVSTLNIFINIKVRLKASALLSNAGCNKQVLLLNPGKKLPQICLVVFEKNANDAPFNFEK